jgi:voltage-gated potassium channel Kch
MAAPRIIYIILRRMRPPLLVLLGSYAISLLGMTLIPGIDDQGKPWTMDFFHAYYFLSYTATTIGFGEIPYPFSDPQRAWVLISIYVTVIAWFYAIGTILSLVQDPALRRVVVRGQFERQVRRIREPFVIVCGFGDTGRALVRALVEHFRQVVVVDVDPEAINELRIKDYPLYVPALAADATIPENLELAGLRHALCNGVVIVTPSDESNLKIAITSKLLNENVPVYSQGEHADIEANMASFGTDYIVDPYARFAQQGALAIRSPGIYLLHHWLNAVPHAKAEEPLYPPRGTYPVWLWALRKVDP